MESVPGAIATGSLSQLIARIEIARIVTRSLPLPVLTSTALSVAFITITMTHTDNPTQIKLINFVLADIIAAFP